MKLKFLLFISIAIVFSSCSTSYRSGQTPDDVYYSPATPVDDNYQVRQEVRPRAGYYDPSLRMAIYDRRWRNWYDVYDPYYDPYHYGYTYGYYYNPYYYYYPVYFGNVTIRDPKNSTPRMTSLGSYVNPNYHISSSEMRSSKINWNTPSRGYYNNSNRSSTTRQRWYDRRDDSGNDFNSRGYNPSSSGSTGSGRSSSGSGVSRPSRGY